MRRKRSRRASQRCRRRALRRILTLPTFHVVSKHCNLFNQDITFDLFHEIEIFKNQAQIDRGKDSPKIQILTNWVENFGGIWGIFGQTTATVLALCVPCPWF